MGSDPPTVRGLRWGEEVAEIDILHHLAVALAVGLVIGLERGWSDRNAPEGSRVAGIRTFALIGFGGGLVALIGREFSVGIAAAMTLGFAGLFLVVRFTQRPHQDVGMTTEVAAIVTFALGVLAGLGHMVAATAGSVGSAFLLGLKPTLHRWLQKMNQQELFAALQLVLISAVILPLLPDQGYGPFDALNPYRVWLMAVVVAVVSFVGYVLVKLLGSRAGALVTGLCGGLASSTATTMALVRLSRDLDASLHAAVASGIVAASATMVVRIVVLAAVIHPPLLVDLAPPFVAMLVVGVGAAIWLWRRRSLDQHVAVITGQRNPLDLQIAIAFAAFLALITLAAEATRLTFGATGLYLLSAASGLADVDAITVSVAQQSLGHLPRDVAVTSLVIAASVNTAVKALLAITMSPASAGRPAAAALCAMLAAGLGALAIW
ncbi:MAG TPA: MgtC/SapB family protein [Alphaproteobacteria bacterium]|nr:MgtC/SapB family protein [Alphaproteobacteria bacterium]